MSWQLGIVAFHWNKPFAISFVRKVVCEALFPAHVAIPAIVSWYAKLLAIYDDCKLAHRFVFCPQIYTSRVKICKVRISYKHQQRAEEKQ